MHNLPRRAEITLNSQTFEGDGRRQSGQKPGDRHGDAVDDEVARTCGADNLAAAEEPGTRVLRIVVPLFLKVADSRCLADGPCGRKYKAPVVERREIVATKLVCLAFREEPCLMKDCHVGSAGQWHRAAGSRDGKHGGDKCNDSDKSFHIGIRKVHAIATTATANITFYSEKRNSALILRWSLPEIVIPGLRNGRTTITVYFKEFVLC